MNEQLRETNITTEVICTVFGHLCRRFIGDRSHGDLDGNERNKGETIRVMSVETRTLSDDPELLTFMGKADARRTSALITEWSQKLGHSVQLSC